MRNIYILILILVLLTGCQTVPEIPPTLIKETDVLDYGVFANLVESNETQIIVADTYYPIQGIFNNNPIEGFYLNETIPALVYNGSQPQYFVVHWNAEFCASNNNVVATIGLKYNGVLCPRGLMSQFLKYAGECVHNSGACVYYLEKGDSVQLVTTADTSTTLTFEQFTTTINKLY